MSLSAGQTKAGAEGLNTFTVTTTADTGAGSLRAAIEAANNMQPGGDFKIVIEVDGTLTALSPEPTLNVNGGHGTIQGRPDTVITGFSCNIQNGGTLTLQNVNVDNSAYDLAAIIAPTDSDNILLLSGSNRIKGNANGYACNMSGNLTIDKAPGGLDTDSTLILTNTPTGIINLGEIKIRGGTVESHGTVNGIASELLVTGGKVIATGNYGILTHLHWAPFPVTINGGTVVARGEVFDLFDMMNPLVVNGGSVDARTIDGSVQDGAGNTVYLVTVTVGEPPVKNTEVSCKVNGGVAFTSITDDEGKLYLWMPEGQGSAEIDVGGTIYRVSGTVKNNYGNTMLARPDPVVTQVFVAPSSATAVSGTSVRFFARVEGLNNPPQAVAWTVENAHQGTAIDGSGLLTISAYESSRTLLVTATSTYDTSKSGTAQAGVLSATGIVLGVVFLLLLLVLLFAFLELGNPFQRR